MSLYQNQQCPVCHQDIDDTQDIVTCPVCGTPHHRECYNQIGHCVNHNLHSAGYDYQEDLNKKFSPKPNTNVKSEASQNNTDSADSSPIAQAFMQPGFIRTPFDNDDSQIGGKPVVKIALAVGPSAQKFIDIFKNFGIKKRKIKWNWCAFLFSSIYFAFRKMYAKAVAIMCVELSAYIFSSACMLKYAPSVMEAMSQITTMSASDSTSQQAIIDAMNSLASNPEFATAATISYAMMGALIAIRIVCGIAANRLYYSHVLNTIDKVEAVVAKQDDSINMPSVFGINIQQTNMTKADMLKLQLSRKGGVNVFAPMLLLYAAMTLMSFASYLIM